MRVVLPDEIFGDDTIDQLDLVSIIAFGYQGRHHILTDPLLSKNFEPKDGTHLKDWLENQPSHLAKEVNFALTMGIEEGLGESRAKEEIRVVANGSSSWDSNPPVVSVQDARRLLDRSLHIIVENGRYDGRFIRTMIKRLLGSSFWNPIRKALDNHWIHIENGGGVGEMRKILDERMNNPIDIIQTCVIFDSDASRPGQPSDASEALRLKCVDRDVDHHQLWRRAIENYLPRKALQASAESDEGPNTDRDMAYTFSGMTKKQRHYFDMKKGFDEDEVYSHPPPLYENLEEDDRKILMDGFVKNISDLYFETHFKIREEWLDREFDREDTDEFEILFDKIIRKI